ncbi:MAG: sensor histidine kinase, partial [Candidatus Aminicenantes bacterium]|nr:sensor histidine kinase [Candidatus Aminicenantes bacterium]
MATYFAPAERTGEKELAAEIAAMSNNPLISGLLQTTNGLLAVLDEHRIVVAYNDSFLQILGLEDSAKVLGLRPGEAIQCIHAYDEPGGCGTSKYCCTCGIAVAIVSSLEHNKPAERICALTIKKSDREVDIAVHARCRPIDIDGKKYLLLFLQDISQQQQRAAIERTFFHDLNNIIGMLVGASELLVGKEPSRLAGIVHKVSLRLMEEVVIQRCLLQQTDTADYQPRRDEIKPGQILTELHSFFSTHPAAYNKKIEFSEN